ncbi:MAG: putative amidohydrolase [Cellvibrionaceae bacterium]|jgi:predicted amidohydrolase
MSPSNSTDAHNVDSSKLCDLRVALLQTSLHWHDPRANRNELGEKLEKLRGEADLIVLPEMFTSGFTTHPETVGESGETAEWLLIQARSLNAAVTGSIACKLDLAMSDHSFSDNAPPFVNRMLFATPAGELFHYDKVHLFRMADEHKRYQAGHEKCIVELKGWRLLLTVCYDLRFPVFCRNRGDYDAMLCVANWPESRRQHWRTLLEARAIENQSYVVGVNRVGTDGKGLTYSGDSMAIDYLGNKLIDQTGEWLEMSTLSKQSLIDYRRQFPVWQDADDFTLR